MSNKRPGGRPTNYNNKLHPKLVKSLAKQGMINENIAKEMDIHLATLYRWKNEHQEFCDSLKEGKEAKDDLVENALLRRALGYTVKEEIKERINSSGQRQRHKKNDIFTLTEEEWGYAKEYFDDKCCYCGSSGDLTKDHVIPLIKDGQYVKENIIPSCQKCNSSKNDSNFKEWFLKQKEYSKQRLNKIISYLLIMEKKCQEKAMLVVTKEITKEIPPDATSMIFWLKNRRSKEWRDKQEIEHSGEIETTNLKSVIDDIKKSLGKDDD